MQKVLKDKVQASFRSPLKNENKMTIPPNTLQSKIVEPSEFIKE